MRGIIGAAFPVVVCLALVGAAVEGLLERSTEPRKVSARPALVAVIVFALLGALLTRDLFSWLYSLIPAVLFFSWEALSDLIWSSSQPSDVDGVSVPATTLGRDRWSTVLHASLTGAVGGVTALLLLKAYLSQIEVAQWQASAVSIGLPASILDIGKTMAVTSGALAGFALGLLNRAWGRWVMARIELAISGRLPWLLMAFLEDAHRRGVLRRTGARYLFRHDGLQDYLAGSGRSVPDDQRGSVA